MLYGTSSIDKRQERKLTKNCIGDQPLNNRKRAETKKEERLRMLTPFIMINCINYIDTSIINEFQE